MNSTLKEELKKRIKIKDSLIIDLTDITLVLNEEILNYILKRFEKLLNETTESTTFLTSNYNLIGSIKWNSKSYSNLNLKCRKIMDKLELYLLKHNESFVMYPTDYVHCLLAYHSYSYSSSNNHQTLNNKTQSISKSSSFLSRFSSNNTNLELVSLNNNNNNEENNIWNKLVKDDWKVLETFQDKEYKSVLYSNDKNKQFVLTFHIIQQRSELSSSTKKDLVTQCLFACIHARRAFTLANEKKYFLSFTGYSLGACLAELCAHQFVLKAVTFESFGTGLEQELSSNQITTYLNMPNFMNSSSDKQLLANLFALNNTNDNSSFYSSGFKTQTSVQGLDSILKELETSQKFKQIIEWPRILSSQSSNLIVKLDDFDFDQAFYSVTFHSAPKEIKYTASSSLNQIQKQLIQTCVDHMFKCYLNIQTNSSIKNGGLDLDLKFKLADINLFRHVFKSIDELNSDSLVKLYLTENLINNDDEFLSKQINNLKSMYKLEITNDLLHYSIISQKCEINQLRDRLHRLQSIEPKLLLLLLNNKEPVNPIINSFKQQPISNLLLINKIENIFKTDQLCCLYGPSGSGKSSLAKQYSCSSSFKQIKWIDSDCFEKIQFNFKLLLNELNLLNQIESKSIYDFFDKCKLILNEYAVKENVKFLLIIDNLVNERDLDLLMFGFNFDFFKFLITTKKQLSINEFPKLERIELQITSISSTTVNYNSQLIKQECLKASDFLNYLAFLDGNWNLTLNLMRFLLIDQETNDFNSTLNYLIKNNFLQFDPAISQQRFSIQIHLQNEIIKAIGARKNFILDRLVFTLNSLFDTNFIEKLDFIQMETLFKHSLKILKEDWKTKSKSLSTAELYYKLGLVYDSVLFEYQDALDNYKEALVIFKMHKRTVKINDCLDRIANDYIRLDLNEEAVLILKEILNESSSNQPATFSLLASVYEKLKQFDEALNCYLKSIELIGGMSLQIADEYYKIASIYLQQKNYANALDNFKHVLKIRKELLVSNHPSIAKCLLDLAEVNYKLGKLEDSLKSYKEAQRLIINKTSTNNNNDLLVHVLNMIGNIYFSLGHQFEEALRNYKEALRLNTNTNKAMILNNMGLVLSRLDKNEESLVHFKEALALKKESLTENHVSIGNTLNNMGNVYFKMKQIGLALEMYNEAYRIFNSTVPCSYAHKAETLANIGVCYKCMGDHDLALDTYEQVLAMKKEKMIMSMQHPSIAKIYNNIGNVYRQIGKNEEALNSYKESLRIYRETLPSNHFSIANVLFNMDIINRNLN